MENLANVSIVIVSKDRHESLLAAVESVKAVDYPQDKREIVVVEEGDGPRMIEGTRYIFHPRRNLGFGYGRNLGLKASSGQLIAFTDDDCEVEKNWLKELVLPFTESEIFGVAGAVLVRNCNLIGYSESVLGFPGGGTRRFLHAQGKCVITLYLSTCNCAYRREVFKEIGGFNEDTVFSGEDYLLAREVVKRHRCIYNPHAVVYHRPRGSWPKIFKWFRRRGISEVHMTKYFKGRERSMHLLWIFRNSIILRLFVLIVLLKILGLNRPTSYIILAAAYYFYILIREWSYSKVYNKRGLPILVPFTKGIMDLGMEWGKILGFLVYSGRSRIGTG